MTPADLENFKAWFRGFTARYHSPLREKMLNIALKEKHTWQVCGNAVLIARGEGAGANALLLAECAGLFHDIGRFPQFARYGTFKDSASVNHGELGAQVLQEEGVLSGLVEEERRIILEAVRYHNAFGVARLDDPEALFHLKLIRDADKLDIWRIFIEYFAQYRGDKARSEGLGIPAEGDHTEETLGRIFANRLIPISDVSTLDDYKLVQLSWVYGLNFRTTYRLLLERQIIEQLTALLPDTEGVRRARAHLLKFATAGAEK